MAPKEKGTAMKVLDVAIGKGTISDLAKGGRNDHTVEAEPIVQEVRASPTNGTYNSSSANARGGGYVADAKVHVESPGGGGMKVTSLFPYKVSSLLETQ